MDQLFARISSGGTAAWYLTDRMGSVRGMTDATGTPQATITYDGFGNVLMNSNSSFTDRYLYTGREFDSITGLQYNRARYYDPTVGRWTQEDPLGFGGRNTNFYSYVSNQPTRFEDFSGLIDSLTMSATRPGMLQILLETGVAAPSPTNVAIVGGVAATVGILVGQPITPPIQIPSIGPNLITSIQTIFLTGFLNPAALLIGIISVANNGGDELGPGDIISMTGGFAHLVTQIDGTLKQMNKVPRGSDEWWRWYIRLQLAYGLRNTWEH